MKTTKEMTDTLLERIGIRGMADELLPLPEGIYDLAPDNPALKEHIVTVYPKTLEDVRMLVGTTYEDGEKNTENMNLPEQIQECCRLAASGDISEENADHKTLYAIANRLLHFPCKETEDLLRSSRLYQKAEEEILKTAKAVPVLLAQDLVVKDGEEYKISVHSAAFHSITIYGTGHITFTTDQVKLTTDSFTYKPNEKGEN